MRFQFRSNWINTANNNGWLRGGLQLPIVVISVMEYKSASVNVHRGNRSPIASVSPPFVAFIIEPSKRRNCSWTSIVQFRSYSTFKRSAKQTKQHKISFTHIKSLGVHAFEVLKCHWGWRFKTFAASINIGTSTYTDANILPLSMVNGSSQ